MSKESSTSTNRKGGKEAKTKTSTRAPETKAKTSSKATRRKRSADGLSLKCQSYTAKLPQPDDGEYKRLVEDVRERGILVPVELDEEGNVLDGAQRLRVCQELGITPPTIIRRGLSEEEKRAHALTLNLTRRHLGKSERQTLHRELRKLGKSLRAIAEASGVSEATVRRDTADLDNPEKVVGKDGKAYLGSRPAPVINMPEAITQKDLSREERIASQPALPPVPPPAGEYQVIYADPPWELGGNSGAYAIENHYETQTLDEIKKLPIPAADNSILFLWVVSSKLREGLETMDAWGFEYLTNVAWVKNMVGTGRIVRSKHELLLIGRKGKVGLPDPHTLPSSVIEAPRKRHSEKPDAAYELIEHLYPSLTKRIELYARRPRKGWRNWGKEAPDSIKALGRKRAKVKRGK